MNTNSLTIHAKNLDVLLRRLGFQLWEEIVNQCVLPLLNLIGVVSCSLSVFIFFQSTQFRYPIFFYYRLLTISYLVMVVLNLPPNFAFLLALSPI